MRLSLQTDFALRTLMYLAAKREPASVDEIADAYGVSRHHLMKVARRLQELGHIRARRGRGGGVTLARPPSEINVGDVVRKMETLCGFVDCFAPDGGTCPIAGMCGLQGALRLALDDFLKRLDGYCLQDILPRAPRFADGLGIDTLFAGKPAALT